MKKVRVGKIILITALIASAVSVTGLLLSNNNNAVETQATTYTPSDPATYYQSIGSNATGTNLLYSLQSLNSSKRRTTVGYGNMGTSPSGQFKYTDYDPTTVQYDSNNQPYGTKLIGFYSGTS
ncbi:MAG: hypothetical protein HUJ61_08095, partial [Bacilli bacterium]|nr:hypothetical protein [Bacilli bacterium]